MNYPIVTAGLVWDRADWHDGAMMIVDGLVGRVYIRLLLVIGLDLWVGRFTT